MTNSQKRLKSVTISIVSHHQQDLILPLLEQLERLCSPLLDKVVITVNVPEPALIAPRRWEIPVEIVTNTAPQGFGANHNAAFTRCISPWFLVLNPDVRLEADVLSLLLASAPADAGLLAPRVREPKNAALEPHRDLLTPLEILRRRRPGHLPPTRPAWIAGLFMLFRAQTFHQIEGFDPRFFMYGEDFDICARVQLAGWRLEVREDVSVLHEAQRDSHRSRRHLYWHISSLAKVWLSRAFWRYRAMMRGR